VTVRKYEFVSPYSVSTINFHEVKSFKPDIVNIHNWYNFLSISDLLKIAKKYPVVFTLHDSRLATGGCHVTLGCKLFETNCRQCPAIKLRILAHLSKLHSDEVFSKLGPYAVVSPSSWLLSELSNSIAVKESKYSHVIHNPININNYPKREHFSQDVIKAVFVSASLDSEFKGLKMLMKALHEYSNSFPDSRLEVDLVGNTNQNYDQTISKVKITTRGVLDQASLEAVMVSSDLLLVPSQSDNFPNVISEAQLFGTLVVGTKVGGIPEMIEDGVTGVLSENNPSDFAYAINKAIEVNNKTTILNTARIRATERSNQIQIVKQYSEVYEKMLQK
jgi:glycosyltransferase involved in cell wall biosynthesis